MEYQPFVPLKVRSFPEKLSLKTVFHSALAGVVINSANKTTYNEKEIRIHWVVYAKSYMLVESLSMS